MKRRKLGIAILALSLGLFVSCKDGNTEATPTQSGVETNENPKTTAKLNPEHGLPGHRCDLPVGAPLNSASNKQQMQSSKQSTSSSVSPIRLDKTPAVNPPHGEPGHDCSVPVGAPLK